MNKVILILVVSAGLSIQIAGQQIIFKTYNIQDGLISNPVRRIFQDSKGFMWILTVEGLSRYDGNKFTNFTTINGLAHDFVNDIREEPGGKLYLAENDGTVDIFQYDTIIHKNGFNHVRINEFFKTRENKIIAISDSSGFLEFRNGILTKPAQSLPLSSYEDITEWHDSVIIVKSPFSLHFYNKQYQLLDAIDSANITCVYTDSKNRLWAGTIAGLKQVEQVTGKDHKVKFRLIPVSFNYPLLEDGNILNMLEDGGGNMWVGTDQGLVKIFRDGTIKTFTEKDGLPSPVIYCIYEDVEKNIWIGTLAGLAKLISRGNINIYSKSGGFASFGNTIMFLFKNEQLLVTGSGPSHVYDIKSSNLKILHEAGNVYDLDLIVKKYPLLVADENNPVENHVVKKYQVPVGGNFYSVSDIQGNIFSASIYRLYITTGGVHQKHNLPDCRIQSLTFDNKGYLWLGTWSSGLFRASYKKIKDSFILTVKDFTHLLPDRSIRSLYVDKKGNIWVGTRYKGLVKLTPDGNDGYNTWGLDYRHGIMSNWIMTFAEDAGGNMWVGSYMGLDKLVATGSTFRIFNFSKINNYSNPFVSILPMPDNSLWCITSDGLVHIIDGQFENRKPLPVFLTNVSAGDKKVNDSLVQNLQTVSISYRNNQAQFEFTAPGLINEKQVLYNYRLLGSSDTSWSNPANTHSVSYASLQPGDYRFEVRTIGWNGSYGVPAAFTFIITPPYWRTGWFYAGIIVATLLLLYAFYRYRIRQIIRVQKIRNRIATDLHDDIGSTLTNISILSELSRQKFVKHEEAGIFLDRIAEEVYSSNQALDDIVWSINAQNDTLAQTLTRMRRYAAEIFDSANIHYSLQMDEQFASRKLNMEQRRDSFLIFKETINNIYKHAQAKNVYIKMWLDNNHLYMNIRDDGKGFDTTVSTHRNGIKNINQRTERWKGSITIHSSPGKGTDMLIHFPVA